MVSIYIQISAHSTFYPHAEGCKQMQNRQRVTKFSDTYWMFY